MLQEHKSLIDWLRFHAITKPNQKAYTFLIDGEEQELDVTFGQLDNQARLVGGHLQQMGLAGERILLLYPYGIDYVISFLACIYAGAIAVPAYPIRKNQSLNRLESIVSNSEASLALVHNKASDTVQFAKSEILKGIKLCSLSDFTDTTIIEKWTNPEVSLDDIAFLQYTSGSTGIPKGVMVTHKNIAHNQEQIQAGFQTSEKTVGISWLPLYHDMGLIGSLLQPLFLGAYCVFLTPEAFVQKPIRWFKAISKYKATTSAAPNFAYDLCVKSISSDQMEGIDLSSWTLASNGAEPVRIDTMRSFAEKFSNYGFKIENFYPCYGMAEATLIVSGGKAFTEPTVIAVDKNKIGHNQLEFLEDNDSNARMFVGCGQPLCGQELVIVNPETCEILPENEIGEIWVTGESVTKGYWGMEEVTNKSFNLKLKNAPLKSFVKSGDLGFIHVDNLYITGRIKDVIIINGVNYYPQDIELTVEESHISLKQGCGAAFSVEIDGEERLVITQEVERVHMNNLNHDEVYTAIRNAVVNEHHLIPHAIVLLRVMSIPKTSSGKIQRHASKEAFLNNSLNVIAQSTANAQNIPIEINISDNFLVHFTSADLVGKRDLLLKYCINLMAETLVVNPETIPLDTSFLEIGLDSLMAIKLCNRIEKELTVRLDVTEFIEGISTHELVAILMDRITQKANIKPQFSTELDIDTIDVKNLSSEQLEHLLEQLLVEA
jgi:acyl-CoA synthetase (AMP-forming)/AMP-acid ligase II/acyl carrier protein